MIGEAGNAGEIQDGDAGGLFFLRGANGNPPAGFRLIVTTGARSGMCIDLRQNSPPIAIVL
jgi:hypothetical protein